MPGMAVRPDRRRATEYPKKPPRMRWTTLKLRSRRVRSYLLQKHGGVTMSIETIAITGRRRQPLRRKLNPLWWFLNDAEQRLDDGTTGWYMPGQPQWLRRLCWELRNPLQNLRAFVLGVQDKNYRVVGRAPVMTVQRDDLVPPQLGWQWCVLYGGDLVVPRVFVSHCGRRVT